MTWIAAQAPFFLRYNSGKSGAMQASCYWDSKPRKDRICPNTSKHPSMFKAVWHMKPQVIRLCHRLPSQNHLCTPIWPLQGSSPVALMGSLDRQWLTVTSTYSTLHKRARAFPFFKIISERSSNAFAKQNSQSGSHETTTCRMESLATLFFIGESFSTFRPSGPKGVAFLDHRKRFSRVGKNCRAKGGKDENFSVIKGAKPSHPTLDGKSFRRNKDSSCLTMKLKCWENWKTHLVRRAKRKLNKKCLFENFQIWFKLFCSNIVACANKRKFLRRNSQLILHSTSAHVLFHFLK